MDMVNKAESTDAARSEAVASFRSEAARRKRPAPSDRNTSWLTSTEDKEERTTTKNALRD